ncbi:MAG: SDR family oxidoreductase [Firmicutes bacterium]|nr:SDR family oxidoreductase [Bacillota bacterium]
MSERKAALVTGGGTGIGKACARCFLERGYDVAITGRRKEVIEETAREFAEEFGADRVLCLNYDVSKEEDVDQLFAAVAGKFGRLDALVNNAGIAPSHPFLETSYAEYDRAVKVNQYGTFMCMQRGARLMIEKGISGVIINMASIYGRVASGNIVGYNASKAAIEMMTKSAAFELAPYNIRVVAIAPGVIDTPMLDIDKQRGTYEELYSKGMRKKPLPPAAIGEVVAFLASEAADGVNAVTIPVDDGFLGYK